MDEERQQDQDVEWSGKIFNLDSRYASIAFWPAEIESIQ